MKITYIQYLQLFVTMYASHKKAGIFTMAQVMQETKNDLGYILDKLHVTIEEDPLEPTNEQPVKEVTKVPEKVSKASKSTNTAKPKAKAAKKTNKSK